MKAETKEQLRARLNLAEDALQRAEAKAQHFFDAWTRDLEDAEPRMRRLCAAAFVGGCGFGGFIVWAMRSLL